MKLKGFRIISIVFTALGLALGIVLTIYNIMQAEVRQDEAYLLYLICFLVGVLFLGFEIGFTVKAFKEGTLLLHGLCMKEKSIEKRPATLIISLVVGALCIGYLVFNILAYTGTIEINQSLMAVEFNMYFCIIILLNMLELIFYWLFIVQEDIGVRD